MRHEFEIEGKRVVAESQWIGDRLWIYLNGRCFPYESEVQKKQRKARGKQGQVGDILAPMPGKITRVLAQKGAKVEKGVPLVVMEAMKMEYTLKSEGPGAIESVECAVGDQVTLGKTLIKIKSNET